MSKKWEGDPKGWPHTPKLSVYLRLAKGDPKLWWRIDCGHHENLFDEALEALEECKAQRLVLDKMRLDAVHALGQYEVERFTASLYDALDAARAGRPLGVASGGEPGFWDRLGDDGGGLPAHLPMGVNERGQGPEDDSDAHHYQCWCGDVECPLTLALGHAWAAGRRSR